MPESSGAINRKSPATPDKPVPLRKNIIALLLSILFIMLTAHNMVVDPFNQMLPITQPNSATNIHYWHATRFTATFKAMCFRIQPEDFPKLLRAYPFSKEDYLPSAPTDYSMRQTKFIPFNVFQRKDDYPLPLPTKPIMQKYSYQESDSPDSFHIDIYTDTTHSLVYIFSTSG